MTRTGVMASSRPQTEGDASGRGRLTRVRHLLSIALAASLLALALAPGAALAESTYTEKPTEPTTSTPKSGVAPSKESEEPAKEAEPTTTAAPTSSEKASTLPFTGFDLRWEIAFGVAMILAGGSIVAVQRRHRRQHGR